MAPKGRRTRSTISQEEVEHEAIKKYFMVKRKRSNWDRQDTLQLLNGIGHVKSRFNYLSEIEKHVKTKSKREIRMYIDYLTAIDKGEPYQYFKGKSPLDGWQQICEEMSKGFGDDAKICLPQLFEILAIEPVAYPPSTEGQVPNFGLIYKYIAAFLKEDELPIIGPLEATVICDIYDTLVARMSFSNKILQKEFMLDLFVSCEEFTVRKQTQNNYEKEMGEDKGEPSSSSICTDNYDVNIADKDAAMNGSGDIPSTESGRGQGAGSSTRAPVSLKTVEQRPKNRFPSINPFSVPFDILEFTRPTMTFETFHEKVRKSLK